MKQLVLFVLIALTIGACKKDFQSNPAPANQPANFKELKASNNFSWTTYREITLDVEATKTYTVVKGPLTVTSKDGKDVYFMTAHQMDKAQQLKFNLSSRVKEVVVSFGTIKKTISVTGTTISFDCKPTLPAIK